MAVPTPAIPSFTDGLVVNAAALNALAANLTNLYNYNQGGFSTQRPAVIAVQTTGQVITSSTDTQITFNSAPINTNNMWTASQNNKFTIQTGGIYVVFGLIPYGNNASSTISIVGTANLWVNGTSPSNAVAGNDQQFVNAGLGISPSFTYIGNFAAGTVLYLDAWHTSSPSTTLRVSPYGAIMAAVFLTPST